MRDVHYIDKRRQVGFRGKGRDRVVQYPVICAADLIEIREKATHQHALTADLALVTCADCLSRVEATS